MAPKSYSFSHFVYMRLTHLTRFLLRSIFHVEAIIFNNAFSCSLCLTGELSKNTTRNYCKMHSMLVYANEIFKDDNDTLPRYFHSNYCSGECDSSIANGTMDYRYLQINKPKDESYEHIPGLCCVPTKLGDMTTFKEDSNGHLVHAKGLGRHVCKRMWVSLNSRSLYVTFFTPNPCYFFLGYFSSLLLAIDVK